MTSRLSFPGELISQTTKTALEVTNWTLRAANGLAREFRPGKVQPDVLAQQAILKQYEHHVGIDTSLFEPTISENHNDELRARAEATAHALEELHLIDDVAVLELRPILPADALRDHDRSTQRDEAVRMLRDVLIERDINATYNPPILPTVHVDSPVHPNNVWGAIAKELDGLEHQLETTPRNHLAMLAITEPVYLKRFFGPQIAFGSAESPQNSVLALEYVGDLPTENILGRRVEKEARTSGRRVEDRPVLQT